MNIERAGGGTQNKQTNKQPPTTTGKAGMDAGGAGMASRRSRLPAPSSDGDGALGASLKLQPLRTGMRLSAGKGRYNPAEKTVTAGIFPESRSLAPAAQEGGRGDSPGEVNSSHLTHQRLSSCLAVSPAFPSQKVFRLELSHGSNGLVQHLQGVE